MTVAKRGDKMYLFQRRMSLHSAQQQRSLGGAGCTKLVLAINTNTNRYPTDQSLRLLITCFQQIVCPQS
jgi:hypothetical protein